MLTQLHSAALEGVDAYLVEVEVNVAPGLPSFSVVGLPQGAVREGKERVLAALRNIGRPVAPRKITVNLAPADVRKEGSAFDLPVALGLIAEEGGARADRLTGTVFVGEVGLDGALRPVRGAIAVADRCREAGIPRLVLPVANGAEASIVPRVEVLCARTLAQVIDWVEGRGELASAEQPRECRSGPASLPCLSEIQGQETAKRALEVAAAGLHNLLLVGPPGSGKTMLARRLPGLLPPLDPDRSLEVTKIHSVAGTLPSEAGPIMIPPFRAPHHTASDAGLIGGGNPPLPGEVSLAHHGVLFLDELPEFRRNVLEALRQPLEEGEVVVARAHRRTRFPSRTLLIAAMNPCPCGFLSDLDRCICDPLMVRRYRGRVSGPLMDRIDLHVEVPRVAPKDLSSPGSGPTSVEAASRVAAARARQMERFAEVAVLRRAAGSDLARSARGGVPRCRLNGEMSPAEVRRHCALGHPAGRLLDAAMERLGLSARAYHRILKVARTIADLTGSGAIEEDHLAEAVQYRALDRSPD